MSQNLCLRRVALIMFQFADAVLSLALTSALGTRLNLNCCTMLPAAGVPVNTAKLYCPSHANATSCYYIITTVASFATHKANCTAMGGYLVAYNSAFEQLDVETYFMAQGTMSAND